jgi:hypothetical protein
MLNKLYSATIILLTYRRSSIELEQPLSYDQRIEIAPNPDEHLLQSIIATLPDRDAQEMLGAIKDCRQIDYGEW